MSKDTIDRLREFFNIRHWGEGFFDIDARGHIAVHPDGKADGGVDLLELTQQAREQGLRLPILFRFGDIIGARVGKLCDAFENAMAHHGYEASYTAVYPIKVNQQRSVVDDLLKHGGNRVGMEAGSKPELMAVLALAPDGSTIVCNGYKDREYLRLAMIGQQLGHRVYIVVEKLSELGLIMKLAKEMGVRPRLGCRVRLSHASVGKWQDTGGEKSKFGLRASQLLDAAELLASEDMLDCLELLHFHLGSQIGNIRDIARGMREAGRAFAEMRALGVDIRVMDVGGGLGIDYEGTRSRSMNSTNYSIEQYAHTIVRTLAEICNEYDLPHPGLITESGRAMTAHHAVLVTNVIDHESIAEVEPAEPSVEDPMILHDLWEGFRNEDGRPALEIYQDALYWLGEAQAMYVHGVMTLEQRARAERSYHAICRRVHAALKPASRTQREMIDELNEKLADKYFCNMSVFQSLPDVWAIDQVFPIMPIHRLDEFPDRRALLQDLTCDSDGRIEYYVDADGVESTLALHSLREGEEYLLGFFLVGAYQEILGDMHNLFGDTDSVNVERDDNGRFSLVRAEQGDRADEVLAYVHFEPQELLSRYRDKIEATGLDATSRQEFLRVLEDGLAGYTYLEE